MRRSLTIPSSALILATLAAAAACDKAPPPDPNQVLPTGAPALDLSSKPQILFQVFGDKAEPKMMPIAAIVGGTIQPIGLSRQGWRDLDSTYFADSTKYDVWVNDAITGSVTVKRGMWAGQDEPLYPLPGCKDLRPLASVSLSLLKASNEPTVEFIAASSPLTPHPRVTSAMPSTETIARLGRQHGLALGIRSAMDKEELDSLDFIARMLITGARTEPTLLVSFIDQQAGDLGPGVGHTSHILALFDKVDTGYVATYRHVKSGEAKTVEFQRLVDHIDVDGDGVDEMIIESWHYAGSNELVVLNFKAGQWHEALRAPSRWCLDPPARNGEKR